MNIVVLVVVYDNSELRTLVLATVGHLGGGAADGERLGTDSRAARMRSEVMRRGQATSSGGSDNRLAVGGESCRGTVEGIHLPGLDI